MQGLHSPLAVLWGMKSAALRSATRLVQAGLEQAWAGCVGTDDGSIEGGREKGCVPGVHLPEGGVTGGMPVFQLQLSWRRRVRVP